MAVEFTALACHFCERKKPESEVLWKIHAWTSGRDRYVGWMTGDEIDNHPRITKTRSSTNCPPCGSSFLGYPSVAAYKSYLMGRIGEMDWVRYVIQGIEQFEKYQIKEAEQVDSRGVEPLTFSV